MDEVGTQNRPVTWRSESIPAEEMEKLLRSLLACMHEITWQILWEATSACSTPSQRLLRDGLYLCGTSF